MGARVAIMTETEDEANAWLAVFRSLGMQIIGRPSNRITHDGSWMVRAHTTDQDRPQSQAS
jgi:hypothetical protein